MIIPYPALGTKIFGTVREMVDKCWGPDLRETGILIDQSFLLSF